MQNLFKKVTGKIRKNMSNIIAVAGGIATTAAMYGIDVYADANTSEITNPINTVLTIFKAIVMAIGGIILLKNIVETAQAYQQQDSSGMHSGLKGIAAGAIMLGAGTIMTILNIPRL